MDFSSWWYKYLRIVWFDVEIYTIYDTRRKANAFILFPSVRRLYAMEDKA